MTNRRPLSRALPAASLGLALLALPMAAQESGARLRGLLLTEGSGVPVEGAHVTLVDPDDVVLAEALSDERGAFSPAHAASGDVPVQPIPLPELSVSEGNECPTTPEERRRAFELYESVLPILASLSSTADLGTLRMHIVRPIVEWRRGAYRYAHDTATVDARTSLNNAVPEYLEAHGYAEVLNDSMTTFYAPDGDALASPGFLATHCLSTVQDADETRIGLGFEPKPGRRVVDVNGVLWIDTVAGGPRQLEFRYTSPLRFLRRHLEPTFRVARDRWLIREWTIVRPRLLYKGLYEVGKRATIWPRADPLTTSGRVLALIRP